MSAPQVYLTGGGGTGAGASSMLNGDMVLDGKNLVEGFDMEYGRMNAVLGSTPNPLTPTVGAGPVVGAAFYIDPPTENLKTAQTSLWRISHIGVDSHAIHFHLFNVQVINRVDWTNTIKPPYPEELGWKETIRTNPFEDVIVALRPVATDMKLPFGIPDSNRLLDPTMPAGSAANFLPVAPPIGLPAVAQTTNVMTNFGWEYVWHCHLLGHEENDMMRPITFSVPSVRPTAPVLSFNAGSSPLSLTWIDSTPWNGTAPLSTLGNPANEIGFLVERASVSNNGTVGTYTQIGTALANATTYADSTASNRTWSYRVTAYNVAGNSASNSVIAGPLSAASTNLAATIAGPTRVNLTWTDNATNETGFRIERAVGTGAFTSIGTIGPNTNGGNTTFNDTAAPDGQTLNYRVIAFNLVGDSAPSNTATVTLPFAGPTNLAGTVSTNPLSVSLTWNDNSISNTGFQIQRSTSSTFTGAGLTTYNVTPGTATSFRDTTGLVANTTYYYRVCSALGAVLSPWSNTATVRTTVTAGGVPAAPTNLRVTLRGLTSISLAWNDNATNEQGYYVEQAKGVGGAWTVIKVLPANTTTYTSAGLSRLTTWLYRVRAYNASGNSAYSNTLTTSTL